MADLVYLYGYIPGQGIAEDLPGLSGIGERRVETQACGPAVAVFSRVPSEEYDAERIEARLADLDWLGRQGLAHERVVAALVDRTTVVPMRLFTLFSSDEALRAECEQRADWLRQTLAKLDGVRQWDLKVSYDSERMLATVGETSEEVAVIDAELVQAAPGRRYLLRKQRDDVARSAVRKAVAALGEEVLARLAPVAADVKRLAPPSSIEPGKLPVILAAALLVSRADESELRAALEEESARLGPRGVRIACSGPWAAYRFVGA
ncbi:MAG TPA: GvpL/GvpF family gas vesicle protein [Longimicrobiales bacterium]|nr:GvpL/GvpF family gas vesicle protein [Longimicrobiales bacterium]